jgi:TolA-binding protein
MADADRPSSTPDAGVGALAPLLELARVDLTDLEPRRGAASLAAVQRRLARRRRHRMSLSIGIPALAGLTLALWLVMKFVVAPLEMEVLEGSLSPDGIVSAATSASSIRFSDGTALLVEPAARARVSKVNAHGADIRLEGGKLRLSVAKRPGARWNVLAGAYRVHVTGTSLAVALADGGERIDVQLFSGAVRVSGPLIEQGIDVKPSQRLRIDGERQLFRIETIEDPSASAPPTQPAAVPAAAPPPEPPPPDPAPVEPARRARAKPARPPAPSWAARVAAGDFAAVLSAAEARGLDDVYQRAPLADLEALADAARYARRTSVARDALLAQRRRFAGSTPAKQAAFLLGRLQEDESTTAALEWYGRYLEEEPDGPHAPQALGRKMLLLHRQRSAEAETTARQYLERFPNGSHAANAKRILAGH